MLDGTYQVAADTPLGRKSGVLVLSGFSTAAPRVRLLVRGASATITAAEPVGADGFRATGELRALLGCLSFTCTGAVHGDTLSCTAATDSGTFSIVGTRRAS